MTANVHRSMASTSIARSVARADPLVVLHGVRSDRVPRFKVGRPLLAMNDLEDGYSRIDLVPAVCVWLVV